MALAKWIWNVCFNNPYHGKIRDADYFSCLEKMRKFVYCLFSKKSSYMGNKIG
jgi:hypothetical protein